MIKGILFKEKLEGNWISISDLMAGLMMIFLFIAISYMNNLQIRAKQIKKIAVAYQELQNDLYDDLYNEFKNDLEEWKAEIDRETLSFKFKEPDVLFGQGRADVTVRFNFILIVFNFSVLVDDRSFASDGSSCRLYNSTFCSGLVFE